MIHTLIISLALALQPSTDAQAPAASMPPAGSMPPPGAPNPAAQTFDSPRDLLDALADKDTTYESMSGNVRYTVIKALESDLQQRFGDLYIRTTEEGRRQYAVSFDTLVLGDRQSETREHYIFDGRWFVERLHDERQFNKRELVPEGETLDPMDLMREAPFWVSIGSNTEKVLETYDLALDDPKSYLDSNEDFPELKYLAQILDEHTLLRLEPKPGSSAEDDWESVRIWFDNDTLLPRLYIKTDWTGDLQIVELSAVTLDPQLAPTIFDTRTPPPESGWRTQISPWRGHSDTPNDATQ